MNPGFDPEEIAQLKKECRAEGMNFIHVEDELEEDEHENTEHAHVQFIGYHNSREVVYDALFTPYGFTTLQWCTIWPSSGCKSRCQATFPR